MSPINNKIVFITGASSGIGEASARLFAKNGAKLILTARRKERLDGLAEELADSFGCQSLALELDVRNETAVNALFASLPPTWQAIDILINNAGLALSSDPVQRGSSEQWEIMIDTNIKGLLFVSRAILPGMIERDSGHIINLGSIAGQECYAGGNVYCASKHAVRAITKSMRLDLLGTSIRVTEIAPGAVETEFSEVRWNDKEKASNFYKDFNPLLATDIADAIYYCATRPPHVDIAEMTIMPTAQASATQLSRSGRKPI